MFGEAGIVGLDNALGGHFRQKVKVRYPHGKTASPVEALEGTVPPGND